MMRLWCVVAIVVALAPVAQAQDTVRTVDGVFEYQASATGVVISAPHGTFDINTAPIAVATAGRLGAGYVVFRGSASGLRINVNRPTEGAGRACSNEPATERARATYDTYQRLVRAAAGGDRPALYVEVHGNAELRTADRIETATKGLGAADARALKDAFPSVLASVRRETPGFPPVSFLIEPADTLLFTAGCAKTLGILADEMIQRAVHFELPAAARRDPVLDGAAALLSGLLRIVPPRR